MDVHFFIHVVHEPSAQIVGALEQINQKLNQIISEEAKMSAEFDALTAQVAENTTIEGSAVTLIQGIAAQLASAIAANNPAALTALQTSLKTSADALAAAITANTPAPAPAPAP